ALDRGHGYVLSNAAGILLATLFNFAGAKFFAFDPGRLSFGQSLRPLEQPEPEAALPRPIVRAATLLCCVAIGCMAFSALARRELQSDAEAVGITMARNIAVSSALLVRPSVRPFAVPPSDQVSADWVKQD